MATRKRKSVPPPSSPSPRSAEKSRAPEKQASPKKSDSVKTPDLLAGPDSSADQSSLSGIHRPMTLVAQVEQTLRTAIAEGVFPQGRLPTLVDLADQLRVSRETVRLALETLQQEGLIVKRRRRGTVVSAPTSPTVLKRPPRNILGYLFEQYDYRGDDVEVVLQPHSSRMLEGAVMEAAQHDYQILTIAAQSEQLQRAMEQLQDLVPPRGIIIACAGEQPFMKRLGRRSIPTVLLDHEMHLSRVSSIRGDSQQNAQTAVEHLAGLGHRHIACAQWRQNHLNPWFLRGYRQGMQKEGLKRRRTWELLVRLNRKGARDAVAQLEKLTPRPTALICFHNTFANQLITAAEERGIHVPNDLSVVGGGGAEVVNLTSTQLDWHRLGRDSVQLLLKAIQEGDQHAPEHRLVPYQLNLGSTTAPPQR